MVVLFGPLALPVFPVFIWNWGSRTYILGDNLIWTQVCRLRVFRRPGGVLHDPVVQAGRFFLWIEFGGFWLIWSKMTKKEDGIVLGLPDIQGVPALWLAKGFNPMSTFSFVCYFLLLWF